MALAALTTTLDAGTIVPGHPLDGYPTPALQKIFLEAANRISLLLEDVKLEFARFVIRGQDLHLYTPFVHVTLSGYYHAERPPLLIDTNGNMVDPDGVQTLIQTVVYVQWGEAALVRKTKLPDSFNNTYILQQQGQTGLLTANGSVLQAGDTFTQQDELVYYHNELGIAWDEIPVATPTGLEGIKIMVAV